jgi:hypothetical protein
MFIPGQNLIDPEMMREKWRRLHYYYNYRQDQQYDVEVHGLNRRQPSQPLLPDAEAGAIRVFFQSLRNHVRVIGHETQHKREEEYGY